jgi:toxin ParE1/3/4
LGESHEETFCCLMKYKIFLEEAALSELTEIAKWYEMQNKGLGHSFLAELGNTLSILTFTPKIYSVAYKKIRRARIKQFPYKVFYSIDKLTVHILRVLHSRRNPNEWKN